MASSARAGADFGISSLLILFLAFLLLLKNHPLKRCWNPFVGGTIQLLLRVIRKSTCFCVITVAYRQVLLERMPFLLATSRLIAAHLEQTYPERFVFGL